MPCAKGPSFLGFSCSPILPGPSIPCDCGLIPGLFDCAPPTSALRPLRFAVGRSAARAETSEETFAARSWRLGPRLGALYGVPLSLLSLVFSEALRGFDVWMQRMCCPVEDLVWRKRCLSVELSREKVRCCTILALVVIFPKRWLRETLIINLGSPSVDAAKTLLSRDSACIPLRQLRRHMWNTRQQHQQHFLHIYTKTNAIPTIYQQPSPKPIYTMLSRSPTKISLTQADIAAFEQRKAANDALKAQQQQHQEFDSSQDTTESLLGSGDSPAAVNAARRKQARERRMGLK
jgi:hypothetical protein